MSGTAFSQDYIQVKTKTFDKMVNEVQQGRVCDSLSRQQTKELKAAYKLINFQDSALVVADSTIATVQADRDTTQARFENQEKLTKLAEKGNKKLTWGLVGSIALNVLLFLLAL